MREVRKAGYPLTELLVRPPRASRRAAWWLAGPQAVAPKMPGRAASGCFPFAQANLAGSTHGTHRRLDLGHGRAAADVIPIEPLERQK